MALLWLLQGHMHPDSFLECTDGRLLLAVSEKPSLHSAFQVPLLDLQLVVENHLHLRCTLSLLLQGKIDFVDQSLT